MYANLTKFQNDFLFLLFIFYFDLATVATPKSPRTPTVGGPAVMVHSINHRFTMTFKMLTVCDLCFKQMFIGKFRFAGIALACHLIFYSFLQVSSVKSANTNAIEIAKQRSHPLANYLLNT